MKFIHVETMSHVQATAAAVAYPPPRILWIVNNEIPFRERQQCTSRYQV